MLKLTQEEKETVIRFVFSNLKLVCQLAETECLSPEFFDKLAEFGIEVAAAVARNPNAPPDLLEHLVARYEDLAVAEAVAANPAAPPEVLRALYRRWSEHWRICANLAGNRSLPHDLAEELSEDSVSILCELGTNPGVAFEILEKLALSDFYEVRAAVASNPVVPPHILSKLAFDSSWQVRQKAAANPSMPPEVLKKMFRSAMKKRGGRDWSRAGMLITNILQNPSVPEEILLYASLGEDNYIKGCAMEVLGERKERGGEEQCR